MVAAPLQPAGKLLPFSCSTHLANDVTERLRQAKLSSRALEFCLFLHRQTFGNAGWHRQQGRPEWRCRFALPTWATVLTCDKSNLRRLRLGLEACRIVCFEPDQDDPGQGWIGWNLQFAEWQPYDGRRTRTPAQKPRSQQAGLVISAAQGRQSGSEQQGDIVISPAQAALQTSGQQAGVVISTQQVGASAPDQQGGVVISADQNTTSVPQANVVNLPDPTADAKQPRQLVENAVQMTTPASSEVPPGAASVNPVIKGLRNKTGTPDVVPEARCASPAAPGSLSESEQGVEEPTLLSPATPTQEAHTDAATPRREKITPAFSWPARQAWEKTDLDFYQRALRERESQRVALLTRLAHERIGVPLESASYARIGALAKRCGASLLVKHILLAAAQHIDGDPLDYLTRLASYPHQKENPHAQRSTSAGRPTDQALGTRPYTPEEAKQLVWHVL